MHPRRLARLEGSGAVLVGCKGSRARRRSVVDVEQWAEMRRMHFVGGVSIKEIARRTGRIATRSVGLRADAPPSYRRRPPDSKLDPFREEIHRLLREHPRPPGVRVRELIEPLGYAGSKTILDDYLREVRPLFAPRPRVFQGRSIGRASSAGSISGSHASRSPTPAAQP